QPDRNGMVTITIPDDIGEDERKLISEHLYQSWDAGLTIAAPTIAPEVPEPTVAGIIEVIRLAAAKREQERAERGAKRMAAVERVAAIVRERQTREWRRTEYHGGVGRDWNEISIASPGPAYTDEGRSYDPFDGLDGDLRHDYESWLAEIAAENERRQQAA